jgi:hypothetical protein
MFEMVEALELRTRYEGALPQFKDHNSGAILSQDGHPGVDQ